MSNLNVWKIGTKAFLGGLTLSTYLMARKLCNAKEENKEYRKKQVERY